MSRALFSGIILLSCLTLGGCFSGNQQLTEGAAAGAGIGALLGLGAAESSATNNSEEPETASRAKPLQFFGPAQ